MTAAPLALVGLGWAPDLATALGAFGDRSLFPARVAAADRGSFELLGADGPITAGLAGSLRHAAGPGELPVVGDWVAVEDDPPTIRHVLERRTVLRRAAPTGALQVLAASALLAVFLLWSAQAVSWTGLRVEYVKRIGLFALVLLASGAIYFGALWATGLKLRKLMRR